MSQFEKESLSALLDNEADDLELRRLLRSMADNPDLCNTWSRYNLAQSVLHDAGMPVSSALSARINQQLQTEPALSAVTKTSSVWQQTLSKFAIAASVAAIFVVAFQATLNNSSTPDLVQQETGAAEQQALEPGISLVAEAVDFEVDPATHQRLVKFLESVSFDEDEPVFTEHIQDSPLYQLVNELQANP
ncbi:MAG: sigma-E factor negative regulatory protein [Gammaproteobacteria bacterium]|jgi:negative regulator of sigma E activity|nr:sigma-E factor negative regulatory protein [Gammaproteobacteria bacterium]